MGKHLVYPDQVKTRAYKLLLYPDNVQHMKVLRTLQRHSEYSQKYVGIWHTLHDDDGNEILQGHGKKHAHLLVNLENPVWWQSFAKNLGFVDGEGSVDCRFCMPISVNIDQSGKFVKDGRSSLERGYCYLIHLNTPDKEQYSCTDLWGAESMIEDAQKAVDVYLSRNLSMSVCVYMALDWIRLQKAYVSFTQFTEWLCGTPYFKCQSSPLVRAVLDENNRHYMRLAQKQAESFRSREKFEQASGVPQFGVVPRSTGIVCGCNVYQLDEFEDIEDRPDANDGGILI